MFRYRTLVISILAAFLIPTFFAVRNLSSWPARVRYAGEESYEGVALAEMTHLGRGESIYAVGATNRFDAATYGPLYYLLGEHVINLQHPSYVPLRLLAVAGMLGCAMGCGLLAFWITRSQLAAFLAPLIFLSYGIVTAHGIKALSDGIALLAYFAGFLLAYRFQTSAAVLLAAPAMVLGFYLKPQYIAGPLAVVVFLLLTRRWRYAAAFATLGAACTLSFFAYFQWIAFPGQAFWRHFLLYQTALFSWSRFGIAVFLVLMLFFVPLLFIADYLKENCLAACYLGCALALGLLTFAKTGSNPHYFFETVLIMSTLMAAVIAREFGKQRKPIGLLLVLFLMLLVGQWPRSSAPEPSDLIRHQAIQNYLRTNFSTNTRALGPAPGDLLQAGLETPYAGLFQLTLLSNHNICSDQALVEKIRAHQFPVIVLYFDVWQEHDANNWGFYLTRPMLEAIQSEYVLSTSLELPRPERETLQDRFYVYVPADKEAITPTTRHGRGGRFHASSASHSVSNLWS